MSLPAVRRFVGVDLGMTSAPDETTVLRFRHLLEKHELGDMMLEAVNMHLEARRASASRPARSWTRPSSMRLLRPKTARSERDPRCARPSKGKQWYFGLKAHIGVDSKEGTVHTLVTTSANVADMHAMLPDLLHGQERKV